MTLIPDLQKAIHILKENGFTCVLCKEEATHVTRERGIHPLLGWLSDGASKTGFCAADKVVGKAAAFLYVLLGIKAVYADVISTAALEVLREYDIEVHFDKETEYIINRAGTGRCPMESAVLDIKSPDEALYALKKKSEEMKTGGTV